MNDSPERDATYDWARRHGLHEPYDFAIYYEDLWGDKAALVERARTWERNHALDRKERVEGEIEELRRKAAMIEESLERIETYEYD